MNETLQNLKQDIIDNIMSVRNDIDFNNLLTSLLYSINELSDSRVSYQDILNRMFERLNTDADGNPIDRPFDSRQSSPAFNDMAPISWAISDLIIFAQIIQRQVFVHTATGESLDSFGVDYDLPRLEATRAVRIGQTFDNNMVLADFDLGRVFRTRETLHDLRFEIIRSGGGNVLFQCLEYGIQGNLYFGDLSPAQPINGFGRAAITDTYISARDRESDEEYKSRLLRHLRRVAFGGNVYDYQTKFQTIDGIGSSIIFPVWRGEATSRSFILDNQYMPVNDEFLEFVQNKFDPVMRSGAGFGLVPIGHRALVSTPELKEIDIYVKCILILGIEPGQAEMRLKNIINEYFNELRRLVVSEWERTYYANEGINNDYANVQEKLDRLSETYSDPEFAELMPYFPANAATQTHVYKNIISRAIIGGRLLESRLLNDLDIDGMLIDGLPENYILTQSQEDIFIPISGNITIDFVDSM